MGVQSSVPRQLPSGAQSVTARNRRKSRRVPERRMFLVISAVSIAVVVSLWAIVTSVGLFPPLFLPSPETVVTEMYSLLVTPYGGYGLIHNIAMSLLRVMAGFLLAVATGVPLGLLMGRSLVVEAAINPFMQLYRPVPPLAYIPLLIVWFGIGELPKILLIYLGTVPIIVMDTLSGVRNVKEVFVRVAASLGASRWQIMRYVLIPAALPSIFTGLRIGIGIAWTCLVAAEMIAATSGLGWMILNASRYLRTDIIFVGILSIGVIGLLNDWGLRIVERWLVPWSGKH